MQGLSANAFIEAINRAYGAGVPPMSDQEILAAAETASGIAIDFDKDMQTFHGVSGFVHLNSELSIADFVTQDNASVLLLACKLRGCVAIGGGHHRRI